MTSSPSSGGPVMKPFRMAGESASSGDRAITTTGASYWSASAILTKAAELVGGDRARTHGPKEQNHANIAALWNAYLTIRKEPADPLSAFDAAIMVGLLKIARTQLGAHNPDDLLDGAAYLAIAGEIAEQTR